MAWSTLLEHSKRIRVNDDCEYLRHCCCYVWDLKLEKIASFINEDVNTLRMLRAIDGKDNFIKLLVSYGMVSNLPEKSSELIKQTRDYIDDFIWNIIHHRNFRSMREETWKLIKDSFFLDKHPESYKRIFLAAVAIQALSYPFEKEPRRKQYITCLRMYFSATRDPFLTLFEVKSVLHSCLVATNNLYQFDDYWHVFNKLMPECPAEMEPRKLKDLARCEIRENLVASNLPLPEAVEKLLLPKSLKLFVLCDGIDISTESGYVSNRNMYKVLQQN